MPELGPEAHRLLEELIERVDVLNKTSIDGFNEAARAVQGTNQAVAVLQSEVKTLRESSRDLKQEVRVLSKRGNSARVRVLEARVQLLMKAVWALTLFVIGALCWFARLEFELNVAARPTAEQRR
jgi:FtsZ-binding cell division protein ZapB